MLSLLVTVALISTPLALAKKQAEDFDKSVTSGSTVTFEPTDFCSDFQKIKVPDAAKVQNQCGESMASYVRFAEGWAADARGSGDKSKGCRAIGKRYSELEHRQAELQNCGASCEREGRALYRELADENKLGQKSDRKTPTVRDAHAQLVEQAKKREAAVQSNGKAVCEQHLANAKHAVELTKLGYEQILVNFGELAEAVLSDLKPGVHSQSTGAGGGSQGAGTGMDVKGAD